MLKAIGKLKIMKIGNANLFIRKRYAKSIAAT